MFAYVPQPKYERYYKDEKRGFLVETKCKKCEKEETKKISVVFQTTVPYIAGDPREVSKSVCLYLNGFCTSKCDCGGEQEFIAIICSERFSEDNLC